MNIEKEVIIKITTDNKLFQIKEVKDGLEIKKLAPGNKLILIEEIDSNTIEIT